MKRGKRINLVLWLAALMGVAVACHKVDPLPEPTPEPTPTDTIPTTPTDTIPSTPPVIPTREIVIDWNWMDNLGYAPPKDTISFYTAQEDVKYVYINLTSPNSTGHRPRNFHRSRDTLQTRLDIAPQKVRGSGTIYVNPTYGAHLPNDYTTDLSGMSIEDSIWYTSHGWGVERFQYKSY